MLTLKERMQLNTCLLRAAKGQKCLIYTTNIRRKLITDYLLIKLNSLGIDTASLHKKCFLTFPNGGRVEILTLSEQVKGLEVHHAYLDEIDSHATEISSRIRLK